MNEVFEVFVIKEFRTIHLCFYFQLRCLSSKYCRSGYMGPYVFIVCAFMTIITNYTQRIRLCLMCVSKSKEVSQDNGVQVAE